LVCRCFAKSVVDFAQTSWSGLWEMAEKLAGKRPFASQSIFGKVRARSRFWLSSTKLRQVDRPDCMLRKEFGGGERPLVKSESGGWETAVFLYNVRQQSAPLSAKSVSFGIGFNNFRSDTKASVRRAALPVDAGASPRTACVLAAIHSLADSASATEAGVSPRTH